VPGKAKMVRFSAKPNVDDVDGFVGKALPRDVMHVTLLQKIDTASGERV